MMSTMAMENTEKCEPCLCRGHQKAATCRCLNCSESLCSSCQDVHGSLKATREHKINHFDVRDMVTFQQKALISKIMTCTDHPSDVLTHFCKIHKQAVCRVCSLAKHRKCHIIELKAIVEDGNLISKKNKLIQMAKLLVNTFEIIQKDYPKDKHTVNKNSSECGEAIEIFTQNIISWAEELQKYMLGQINNEERNLISYIDDRTKTLKEMVVQVKKIIKSFDSKENLPEDLFGLIEKGRAQLNETEEVQNRMMKSVKPTVMQLKESDRITKLITEMQIIGRLDIESKLDQTENYLVGPNNFLKIQSNEMGEVINTDITFVSGCSFLPNGELILCSRSKSSFGVNLLTPDFKMKDFWKAEYQLWDVTPVFAEEVVVTDKDNNQIQFLNVSDKITKGKTISVGMECYGIDYQNSRLYVSGLINDKWKIKVLAMNGDIVKELAVTEGYLYYIAVNSFGDLIGSTGYLSSVWCTDADGTTLFKYTDPELIISNGVLFDSCDNFMVCGGLSNSLHVVKKDGTQYRILLTSNNSLKAPFCLAFRESDKTLIVGQNRVQNPLLAFKLEEKNA